MSWAAHELENFFFLKHLAQRVSYLGLLIGGMMPDWLAKLPASGLDVGSIHVHADNPAQWHRGWPGMGFTHSLMAGLILAVIMYFAFKRKKAWFWGIFVGYAAHAITDTLDTAGTMLFWPFYTENISFGMWKYALLAGTRYDALAYYGSLGFVMEFTWIVIVLIFGWRVFSSEFFYPVVWPVDPCWNFFKHKMRIPDRVLLAFYRSMFIYGACRTIAWTIWAHGIEGGPWDLSWGGPYWVDDYEPW